MLLFLSMLGVLIVFIDSRTRPVVENIAAYQVRVFAAKSLNDAILSEMERSGVRYSDIVTLSRNNNGDVASIQSNMVEINRLKANVTDAVIADLRQMGLSSLRVPLGTLLGNELTSGRGPLVEIRMQPVGTVQTELYSQFSSAGINQTLHQIMLKTTVQMSAIIPGYRITTQTDTSFCIAQTIIVGSIPDAYTQINQDDAPLISKINDYAASLDE